MKQSIFVLLIGVMVFASCKKEGITSNSLAGKWRMVSVIDNESNLVTTRPTSTVGDVDLSFIFSSSTSGTMPGITPTNTFDGDFTLGNNNAISIPTFSQTKVMETPWGGLFVGNIRDAQTYFFDENGRLNIHASTNKTLIFVRQ